MAGAVFGGQTQCHIDSVSCCRRRTPLWRQQRAAGACGVSKPMSRNAIIVGLAIGAALFYLGYVYVWSHSRISDCLPGMWAYEGRDYADRRLPVLLRLHRVWYSLTAEAGRLLRILLLRIGAVPPRADRTLLRLIDSSELFPTTSGGRPERPSVFLPTRTCRLVASSAPGSPACPDSSRSGPSGRTTARPKAESRASTRKPRAARSRPISRS